MHVAALLNLGISHTYDVRSDLDAINNFAVSTSTSHYHLLIATFSHGLRTELGYKVGPRLRELAPHGQREPGGGIHAT